MNKKTLFAILMLFCTYTCSVYCQVEINHGTTNVNIIKPDKALVSKTVAAAKIECSEQANIVTKSIFKDFDQEEYNKNPEYKVNNAITRVWYNSFLKVFKKTWKTKLEVQLANKQITLEEYAQIAFEIRHYARTFTRTHMSDINGLEAIRKRDLEIYGNSDGPTFKILIDRRLEKQKIESEKILPGQTFEVKPENLDQAYKSIIDVSTKTNKAVNAFIKCYTYARESWCSYIGDSLAQYMDAI